MHQFSGAWPGDDSTQIERKHLGRGREGGGGEGEEEGGPSLTWETILCAM